MLLHSAELSAAPPEAVSARLPLVVLHGLFGSSRNWRSVGRALGHDRRVVALDLPNHGASPRCTDCSYAAQAEAVSSTLEALGIKRCILMGHSMGGKVAMAVFAADPQRVAQLLVLDIGPWRNEPERELLEAMLRMPLGEVHSRGDAERWLEPFVGDRATLLFLLTNLVRNDSPEAAATPFTWQLGLRELAADFQRIGEAPLPPGAKVPGAVAFLGGGKSDYLAPEDLVRLRHVFPDAELEVLPGVGHNVHVEGGERFLAWVQRQVGALE